MFQMINTNDTAKSFFELFDNERYYYIQLVLLKLFMTDGNIMPPTFFSNY